MRDIEENSTPFGTNLIFHATCMNKLFLWCRNSFAFFKIISERNFPRVSPGKKHFLRRKKISWKWKSLGLIFVACCFILKLWIEFFSKQRRKSERNWATSRKIESSVTSKCLFIALSTKYVRRNAIKFSLWEQRWTQCFTWAWMRQPKSSFLWRFLRAAPWSFIVKH